MEILLKKILTNQRSSKTSTSQWVDDLENQLTSLGESGKTRITEGLQNVLKALEKANQGDIDTAFAGLTETDMEAMADYVCVSMSRPNSLSGEGSLPSIMEPLCLHYSLIFPLLILILKLAPFSLYIWILTKNWLANYSKKYS